MTALPRLHTVAEIAQATGETERYVKDQCRRGAWPHRRGARGSIKFTADDFAQVLELMARPASTTVPRLSFAPRSGRRRSA